ncbi:uncharacterized protein LOC142151670 [Mixophyes fleayi]|uniref:uncharacterized protein LOC142151670 n=1 Tax=Mixophyes fleayi TaxID=3061075 RepID=UPI003F4DF743
MRGWPPLYLLLCTAACVMCPGKAAALPPIERDLIQVLPFSTSVEETVVMLMREDQEVLSHLRDVLVHLLNTIPKRIDPTRQSRRMQKHITPKVKTNMSKVENISTVTAITTTNKVETTTLDIDSMFNLDMEPFINSLQGNEQTIAEEQRNIEKNHNIDKNIEKALSYIITTACNFSKEINSTMEYLNKILKFGKELEDIAGGKPKKSATRNFKQDSIKNQTTKGLTTKVNTEANSERKSTEGFNKLMTFLEINMPEMKSFFNKDTHLSPTEEACAALVILKSVLCAHDPKIKNTTQESLRKLLADELKVVELLLETPN